MSAHPETATEKLKSFAAAASIIVITLLGGTAHAQYTAASPTWRAYCEAKQAARTLSVDLLPVEADAASAIDGAFTRCPRH